jgi:hypothetical protein
VTALPCAGAAYSVAVAGAHRGKADQPAAVARTAIKISAVLAALAAVPALVIYGLVAGPEVVTWSIAWLLQVTVIILGFREWRRDRRYLLWNAVLLAMGTTLRIVDILAGRPHALASAVTTIGAVILACIIVTDAYAIKTGQLDWPWWPARRKPAAPE